VISQTSTSQHTAFTIDRHPCLRRDLNPQSQQTHALDRAATGIDLCPLRNMFCLLSATVTLCTIKCYGGWRRRHSNYRCTFPSPWDALPFVTRYTKTLQSPGYKSSVLKMGASAQIHDEIVTYTGCSATYMPNFRSVLYTSFGARRWTGRNGTVPWLSRSRDSNTSYVFPCGRLKSRVYGGGKPEGRLQLARAKNEWSSVAQIVQWARPCHLSVWESVNSSNTWAQMAGTVCSLGTVRSSCVIKYRLMHFRPINSLK
jgi:hypothetical protein